MSINAGSSPVIMDMDLQDEHGHALVELRKAEEEHARVNKMHEIDSKSISQFNHWLGVIPSSAAAVAGHAKQLMTCSFDYSKLVQVKDGSGAIGAVYKEGSNQIGAQARFHDAEKLQSVVNTGLILNIASQVLAQKHLADINERLKSIEQQVKGILEHLEQSRYAKIKTFQEHLQRVGCLLEQGEDVHPDTLQLLALKAQEVRAEVTHIRDDLDSAHKQASDFDSGSWFGSNDLRVALQEKINRISHLQRNYFLGMQCLLVANLILFIKHGGNKEFVLAGNAYVAELEDEQGPLNKWKATQRQVAAHLSKMKPAFELAKSTQANVRLVESTVAKVQQLLAEDLGQVQQLSQRLGQAQTPRVLLEFEAGRVVRGHYLSS